MQPAKFRQQAASREVLPVRVGAHRASPISPSSCNHCTILQRQVSRLIAQACFTASQRPSQQKACGRRKSHPCNSSSRITGVRPQTLGPRIVWHLWVVGTPEKEDPMSRHQRHWFAILVGRSLPFGVDERIAAKNYWRSRSPGSRVPCEDGREDVGIVIFWYEYPGLTTTSQTQSPFSLSNLAKCRAMRFI